MSDDGDDNILRILEAADRVVDLRIDLDKQLSSGWLSLAKHRYNNAATHAASTALRSDIEPDTLIDIDSYELRFLAGDTGELLA